MYDKVPTNLNFVEREVQTEQFWKEHDIFGKSIKAREGAPVFTDVYKRQDRICPPIPYPLTSDKKENAPLSGSAFPSTSDPWYLSLIHI